MTRAPAEVGSAANSYEILAKLAMGGMAEIFLARGASAAGVERYVVLKRVLRHRSGDVQFVRMFLDEARLAAQLQHPNIAQVYDIGKLGDSFFFTMEYVHGETVRTLLQRSHALRRQIPISAVLSIVAGAAAGLQHAHERKGIDGLHLGIVHRDVSPSNLMISYEGTVKVVDFGVAKASHRSSETQSGTVKGKICYMSPEQCRGIAEIDRRSDLFSLGIVMWEMLTTERLFRRTSDFENMHAIVNEPVPPPSSKRPDVPAELDAIVMRLLAKDPAERFQTAEELHETVEVAAVRTGSALSAASLGRYMRELFGQRPEPWIELATHEMHPEAYTVTSEPLAPERSSAQLAELDRQLDALPPLGRSTPQIAGEPVPPRAQPTMPLRVTAGDVDTLARDMPPNVIALPRPQITRRESVPPPPAAPPAYPSVHGLMYSTAGNAAQYSGSHPGVPRASSQPDPPTRSRRLLVFLAPAIGVGVIIGIVLALGSNHKQAPAPTVVHPPITATPSAPVETAPVERPPVAPARAQPVAVAPEVPPAAPQPAPAPDKKARDGKQPKETALKPDLQYLYHANRFGELFAACATSAKTAAQNPVLCTIAACKIRDATKARRWFATVSAAQHTGVLSVCMSGGIDLKPPPGKDPGQDCKADPFACQH